MRNIGAAEGVIMATIITAHMANTDANSIACQGMCDDRISDPRARRSKRRW
ncbi:MAG TPA: hypothetical protein VKP67_27175 [Xanthobacteraceae bacterium]|nr:hypothetical protein [Xanthobacteraceae bacterium]